MLPPGALLDDLLGNAAFASSEPVNFPDAIANPYLSRLVGGMMAFSEEDLELVMRTAPPLAPWPWPVTSASRHWSAVAAFGAYFVGFVSQWEQAMAVGSSAPVGDLTNRLFEPCPSGRMISPSTSASPTRCCWPPAATRPPPSSCPTCPCCSCTSSPRCSNSYGSEPDLRPAAVEEVLRYISPVTGLFRHTTEPIVLHGPTELPADAKVLLMYGSGNHDERQYTLPDEFVIDRFPRGFADADHLSFTHRDPRVPRGPPGPAADQRVPRAAVRARPVPSRSPGPSYARRTRSVRVIDELPVAC